MTDADDLARALSAVVRRELGPPGTVHGLARLTGGATKATYAFDAEVAGRRLPLILQIATPRIVAAGDPQADSAKLNGDQDAAVQIAVLANGVPAPRVRLILRPDDGLGSGFVTERIEGEVLGRRIATDPALADARAMMAGQLGAIAAKIHATPSDGLDFLRTIGTGEQVALYRRIFDSFQHPHPTVELAFKWVERHTPAEQPLCLVHGDFRNGNLIVGPDGVRCVLDWEIAQIGDPMQDLGWLCVKTWRFGGPRPVGGFGERGDLFAAYEAAGGGAVDPARVAFWEAFGCLKWSIMCMMKGQAYRKGGVRDVEQFAIGRRMEEPLHDFLAIAFPS